MKDKRVLVVERSGSDIKYSNETVVNNLGTPENSIVLTGIFTTFNQKNRNGRIYESADFLPHIEALKETIKNHALLGELDHPHGYEISLTNASHVIESLEYDPQQNAIIGKIRLLNTTKGKEAQALVKDGIPLHISSRAAGTVDESTGRVRLQQLFTYDLVADPGFANAVLSRVNEGYGSSLISETSRKALNELNESYNKINEGMKLISSSDNFEIYETNTELLPEPGSEGFKTDKFGADQQYKNSNNRATNGTIDDTNNKNNMDNANYISFEDFQRYTENLSEIIADLQSAITNYKTELDSFKKEKEGLKPTETFEDGKTDNKLIANLVANSVDAKMDEVEERYNNLKKYTVYLAEQLDNAISHQDYIAENCNKMIEHQDYIAENCNKMIEHQDYIAENCNKMIEHQDYIVENLNDTIGYQNYISEMLDKSIDYSNMLAEEQNKNIAHSNYLVEKLNQAIEHQDYIAENCNKMIDETNSLNEKFDQLKSYSNYISEGMNNIVSHNNYIVESINNMEGVEKINESNETKRMVPANKETNKKPQFDAKKYQTELTEKLGNLISTVKTQYAELKQKEAEQIEESRKSLENANEFKLVNYIPARLKERWANLSDERKQEILSESKMFIINNAETATYFWNTRDMREKQVPMKKINETVTANKSEDNKINEGMSDRLIAMSEQIKYRMRKN